MIVTATSPRYASPMPGAEVDALDSPSWPADFPEGVPPEEATPADELGYRLVNSNPPTRSCFQSTREENPSREFPDEQRVPSYGVSLYLELQHAKRTRRRYKGLRSKIISVGQLSPEFGVTMPTFSYSHFTAWFYAEAEPHLAFAAVEE